MQYLRGLSDHELAVHLFAPLTGPRAAEARKLLDQIWSRCEGQLGTTEPVVLPTPVMTGRRPLNVAQSPDARAQAIIRQEDDVLNLSILISRLGEWDRLDQLADELAGEGEDSLIGVTRLYLARSASQGVVLDRPGVVHAPGVSAWETGLAGDAALERRLAVVGDPADRTELGAWAWSDGGPAMPRLVRYLMHVAKIRYEIRVHAAAMPAGLLCDRLDDDVRGLAQGVPDALYRTDFNRVVERRAALKAVRQTVEISAANAAAALGGNFAGDGFRASDETLTEWFLSRITDDLAYLEASLEGATSSIAARPDVPLSVGRMRRNSEAQREPAPRPAIGIVTAMPVEFSAMRALIDGTARYDAPGDPAGYLIGTMPSRDPRQPHSVVLTQLGDTGTVAAADACANLARSFESVRHILMVGVAAGVPDLDRPERHVRLGDIVVATWGIVDYDHVVDAAAGRRQRQPFPRPSPVLAHAARWLEAGELRGERPWEFWIDTVSAAVPALARPPADTDMLYLDDDAAEPVPPPDPARSGHIAGRPKVHYGNIGSADRSLRSIRSRNALAREHDLIAFEMEGKGLGSTSFAHDLGWLVIRGVSDYGDNRAGGAWRGYASLAAAAYTRALLAECLPLAPR